MGDGYLVAFTSTVQALDAASGIQQAFLEHDPLGPEKSAWKVGRTGERLAA